MTIHSIQKNSISVLFTYINYFQSQGYTSVDVPYIVDTDVSAETKPTWCNDLHHTDDQVYIASGEQGFLQLIKEDKLQCGKFMTLTPCFRDENVLDDTHLSMFLKLELIHILRADENPLDKVKEMMKDVLTISYANLYDVTHDTPREIYFSEAKQFVGYSESDIYSCGIEIGSYGVRRSKSSGIMYVYGTGVAFPRWNHAYNKGVKQYGIISN